MLLNIVRKVVHSHRERQIRAMQGQPGWRRVPAGFWMYVDPNEWLGKTVLMGYYESHLVHFIAQLCRSGDVCLDIGANQGYTALHMAKHVQPDGRVLAVEPVPSTFERLRANIERNRASSIVCLPYALGSRETELMMWYDPSECGHASVHNRSSDQAYQVPVRVARGDQLIQEALTPDERGRILMMKIDVEGYEPEVLAGLENTLQEIQPVLWLEKHPNCLAQGGYSVKDLITPLLEVGYQLYEVVFRRSAVGIAHLTLLPAATQSEAFHAEFADIVAVVPRSMGWERLQSSRIEIG